MSKMDTLFFSKVVYYKSMDAEHITSSHFTMNGIRTMITKYEKTEKNIVYCKNYDSKKGLHSKLEEKWENSKIVWSKWESTLSTSYLEQIFEADNNGFDTIIKSRSHKKDEFTIYKVVYLEWDSLGNWTKRIEYNETDWTGKLVTREIKYRK
jgi:hypothetical protein